MGISRTATGADNIPWFVWKDNAHLLAPVVHSIFNRSLLSGEFPESWKKSDIRPLPKKSNPTENDLRPISITPVISRCFERLVHKFFIKPHYYISLDPLQFGFREASSTSTAAVALQNIVHDFRNSGCDFVRVLSIDLSKAIDTVTHNMIIRGLNDLPGINKHVVNWCCSFLENRKQRVVLDDQVSNWITINRGVPQGTVSGPIFFNCSTNKLRVPDHWRDSKALIKFADDMYPIIASTIGRDDGQQFVEFILEWFLTNGFVVNDSKCKEFIVNFRVVRPISLSFAGFSPVESLNFLGITFTGRLSLKDHINTACRKATRNLYLILKLKRHKFSKFELKATYNALVLSILTYGIEAYGGECSTTLDKIDDPG
jgi:retron-type reverse transcriptase